MIYDKKKMKDRTCIKYKIGKYEISHTTVLKDFGIFFEDNLCFNVHTDNIVISLIMQKNVITF